MFLIILISKEFKISKYLQKRLIRIIFIAIFKLSTCQKMKNNKSIMKINN
jgi:hypothetical protein